jgi:hypothetical protein
MLGIFSGCPGHGRPHPWKLLPEKRASALFFGHTRSRSLLLL